MYIHTFVCNDGYSDLGYAMVTIVTRNISFLSAVGTLKDHLENKGRSDLYDKMKHKETQLLTDDLVLSDVQSIY